MPESIESYDLLPSSTQKRLAGLYNDLKNGKTSQKNYINHMLGELDDFLPESILEKLSEVKAKNKQKVIDKEEFTRRVRGIISCYEPRETSSDGEKENNSIKVEKKHKIKVNGKEPVPSRAAKTKGQQSITSLFASMAAKRKSSSVEDSAEKKIKTETDLSHSSLKRCPDCRQYIDDELVTVSKLKGATAEYITLTNPDLNIYEDDSSAMTDERVQHKITGFSVYAKCGHLCAFDDGLIEKNKELYFCGHVKPIYAEETGSEGGIPTEEMGPINEWFVHGFDGHFPVIGFSTAFAEYFLMEASEEYSGYMRVVKEKTFMSNLVISFLIENNSASYEDLLQRLEGAALPEGVTCPLTEDTLIRHSQFICDQVQSFDMGADADEDLIISTPCIRSLVKLAGVTLGIKIKRSRMVKAVKKDKGHATMTYATTTPLVTSVFNQIFGEEIDDSVSEARRRRCGQCEVCLQPDCGKCNNCKNMVKFGGEGRSKQACLLRRCPNMAVEAGDTPADNEEEEDDMDKKAKQAAAKPKRKVKTSSKGSAVTFKGKPLETIKSKEYYAEVEIGGELYSVGSFVEVADDDCPEENDIGRIEYMWKDNGGTGHIHVHWFSRSKATVLGETGDKKELFLVDECDDMKAGHIEGRADVHRHELSKDWYSEGGLVDGMSPISEDKNAYFFQKWYDTKLARFEDIPKVSNLEKKVKFCDACIRNAEKERRERMIVGDKLDSSSGKRNLHASVDYMGYTYRVGGGCFLNPDAYSFKHKKTRKSAYKDLSSKFDDDMKYPEVYRRSNNYVKGSNDECPDPFRVARILEIYTKESPEDVHLRVAKFYRPEDTHLKMEEVHKTDLNMVYWSEEEVKVSLSEANGSIDVFYIPMKDVNNPRGKELRDKFFKDNDFYFSEAYDGEKKEFMDPPKEAEKSKLKPRIGEDEGDIADERKLRCLDVFAGCGGLSAGLHQCGIAESRWAIEKVEPAARAYALNASKCTVFTDDCNELLKLVMQGETINRQGQTLPQKGEVEMLCGGPPCQGFSGMNRFNQREYSRFKNSLIASYLSYCDYYRPKFFILENVRNFVSYKNSMVLKMALRCLVAMGYQCTFGVMQAGCYGVAQTRRRAIILAAAPGEKLPFYPEPMHVFAPRALQLTVVIDDVKYLSNIRRLHSAPYRTITVRDCMSDLPEIKNGHKLSSISYDGSAGSHFQRQIRGGQEKLIDHVCKEMNPLVAARMSYIPTLPGSDWRLLPNIEVRLSDGTKTKLLKYTHRDPKNGKSSSGALRGVCSCSEGNKCDSEFRQFNTIIPWCLPHTGNRHNHWAGLYGRLEWDGFFSTTVTNPEPMGKQGRVLHPEQHRVVSVRECARSQGFPDSFSFYGTILDKHRQVGNAVPPPLGKALGEEVKKCVLQKLKEDEAK
ncbi:DNA (cytosine-5)-methyltransferase PliMCI-like [Watersipora subatra]|uniref:DNA (cytosine-5)-methyltransferase PliMCI-like n=1 Tax=Watersipora subatra TaxID=2589382 RepID=UPI00355BB9C4